MAFLILEEFPPNWVRRPNDVQCCKPDYIVGEHTHGIRMLRNVRFWRLGDMAGFDPKRTFPATSKWPTLYGTEGFKVRALWIARYCLLGSLTVTLVLLGLGMVGWIDPLAALIFGAYAWAGCAICAVFCIVFQGLSLRRKS
jgi:hypothetical protein